MFRPFVCIVATLCVGTASAQDIEVPWQARLVDSSGTPLNGSHILQLTLRDGSAVELWRKAFPSQTISDGYISLLLSGDDDNVPPNSLTGDLFLEPVYVGVSIDGAPDLSPTQAIGTVPRAASVVGTVRLTDSSVACSTLNPGAAGTMRWTGSDLEFCDGIQWTSLATNRPDGSVREKAATSCEQLHADYPDLVDGRYWVDPFTPGMTDDAFEVQCEMDDNGGGWTLCLSNVERGKGTTIADSNTWWTTNWDQGTRNLTVGNKDQGTSWGNFCPLMASTATEIFASVHSQNNTRTVGDICTLDQGFWTPGNGHTPLACAGSTVMTAIPKDSFDPRGCTNCIYWNNETTPNTTPTVWDHDSHGTAVMIKLGGASAYGPSGIHWAYVNTGMSDPSSGGDIHCGENGNWCYEAYFSATPQPWKKSMQLYVR